MRIKKKLSNTRFVKDIGEYSLVEEIKNNISKGSPLKNLTVIGPGDDAFAGRLPKDMVLVATKDLLVENIHFKKLWTTPKELGRKAMASNISDLAAMGGAKPLYALVGIALTAKTTENFVKGLSEGMRQSADEYGFAIVGGDTVSSNNEVMISITLIGAMKENDLIKRSGARPGDVLMSSGTFGDSAAGLYLLKKGLKPKTADEKYLFKRHLDPTPRLKEAKLLSKYKLATSMIDSSDGLGACAGFISTESKVGIRIDMENIPLSKQLKSFVKKHKTADRLEMILSGGEEYELVFTVKKQNVKKVFELLPSAFIVGTVVKGSKVNYYKNNKIQNIKLKGFEHFK